jgi:cytochrome c-type biogenesis protein CcmH/NrfF
VKALLAPAAVVLAAALGGFAFANLYLKPAPATAQLAVEQSLMCPKCQGVRLDVCDLPICKDMKADIARRLQAGESADAILASYKVAYGSAILASDQPVGTAALVPWAAVGLAVLALGAVALRRRAG